jgi:CDGSH-type Zn-finger protein
MSVTRVTIKDNGPIIIEGDLEIVDSTGEAYGLAGRTKIGLCRCGMSSNSPFCDGTHNREGFESACKAFQLPEPKKKA